MGSPGHLVNANYVNASTNCDALFDTVVKLYGDNRETVCGKIQLKSEISANPELLERLQVQLKSTMETHDAMGARVLKCNLHQALAVVLILRDVDEVYRAETLEKLHNLDTMRLGACDLHFNELTVRTGSFISRSFLEEFKLVCDKHEQLTVIDDLRRRKHDLDHKLGRIKAWRKAWNIAQWIAKFGVTVVSVLIPVAGVGPAATAANNGANGVIALLEPLVDSHLAGQQSSCEVEIDLTAKILNEACFIFHRVKNARVLVELLQLKMGSLAEYAEFLAVTREDDDLAVSMVMDEIKSKAGELVDIIQNLEKEVDLSCEDLRRAALTLLQTVTDQVGNSQHVSIEIPTQ
ncbi:ENTH/VHS domain-containing protein [Dioscorea alata]|uniref:ENTH/VHS domain-containing protein n=1 Tax=Dioscorea alata TaxID=55571 RepID=A0ACB7VQL4_DIOAL|nr:ENTH/VHS domain-containing protein [Dioscorea alata]